MSTVISKKSIQEVQVFNGESKLYDSTFEFTARYYSHSDQIEITFKTTKEITRELIYTVYMELHAKVAKYVRTQIEY